MILKYFISFCTTNKLKVGILVSSVGIYLAFALTLVTLNNSLPEITSLPFKKIGVQTIVQKTGLIPAHMIGAIFPHSNGPIYADELAKIESLDFVRDSDEGLYFWYFDSSYFKTVFGVNADGSVFSKLLKQNIETGGFSLIDHRIMITADFAQKNNITIGNSIKLGDIVFTVEAILKNNLSGNIIPATIYMGLPAAREIAANSAEMKDAYRFKNTNFVNVVALTSTPEWRGDKETAVKNLNKEYIVFSEKTFSDEVANQVRIVSSLGKVVFAILGVVIMIIFGLLITFNFKTREKEIAVLRMIGWNLRDLKKQFIAESMLLLLVAIALGNVLGILSILLLKNQQVTMELPWELSARPHFLSQENAIERVITTNLPIHFDPVTFIILSGIFLVLFGLINYVAFQKVKKIKPFQYLG